MPENKKTFKVGGDIYDIEETQVEEFLKDVPDAIEVKSFIVEKDTFDIPLADVDEFLKDVPQATPIYGEGKDPIPMEEGEGTKAAKGGVAAALGKPQAEPTKSGGSGSAMSMSSAELQSQLPSTLTAQEVQSQIEQVVPQANMLGLDYEKIAQESQGKSLVDIAFEQVQKIKDPKEKFETTKNLYNLAAVNVTNANTELRGNLQQMESGLGQMQQEIEQGKAEYQKFVDAGDSETANQIAEMLNQQIGQYEQAFGQYEGLSKDFNDNAKFLGVINAGRMANFDMAREEGLMGNAALPIGTAVFSNMIANTNLPFSPQDVYVSSTWNAIAPNVVRSLASAVELTGYFDSPMGANVSKGSKQAGQALLDFANNIEIDASQFTPKGTSLNLMDDVNPYSIAEFAGSLTGSIAGSIGSAGFAGSGTGAMVFNAAQGYGGMYAWGKEAGLNAAEASALAAPVGLVYGYLGDKGVESLTSIVGKQSFKKLVTTGIKELGKDKTQQGLSQVFLNSLKEFAKNTAKGAVKEGVQEGVEFSSEFGMKVLASEQGLVKTDDDLTVDAYMKGLKESMTLGALGGGVLGGTLGNSPRRTLGALGGGVLGGTLGNSPRRTLSNVVAESTIDPNKEVEFLQNMNSLLEATQITQQQYDDVVGMLEKSKEANAKVPKSVTNVEARGEAIDLIQEKEELTQEVETIDPAMAKPMTDRIAEIDNTLAQISFFNEQSKQPEQSDWRKKSGLKSIAEIIEEQKSKQLIAEQRSQRDREVEELSKIRPDLTSDDMILGELPEVVDRVLDRMDLNIPTDIFAIDEAVSELDKKFSDIEAYRNNPKRTHTDAQINEVVSLLDAAKTELQYYKEAVIDDEKSINQRTQVQAIPEPEISEVTTTRQEQTPTEQVTETQTTNEEAIQERPVLEELPTEGNEGQAGQESAEVRTEETGQEEVTPTTEINAEEQQNRALRNESEQVQTEGAVDSDMPVVNETELQNREAITQEGQEEVSPTDAFSQIAEQFGREVEKEVSKVKPESEKTIDDEIREAKEELKNIFKEGGNIGVVFDPKKEAARQFNIHKQIVTLAKLYAKKGIQSAQEFAREIGLRLEDVRRAWDEATGGNAVTEKELEDNPYDREFIRNAFNETKAQQVYGQVEQEGMDVIDNGATNFEQFDIAMAGNPNYNSLNEDAKKAMYFQAASNYANKQAINQEEENRESKPLINLRPQTRFERLRTKIQNSMARLKDVQEQMKEAGVEVYEEANAALKFELLIGKAKSKIEDKFREVVRSNNKNQPALLQRLKDEGGNADELGIYMYALHAKERNAANAQERQSQFDEKVRELNDKITNTVSPQTKAKYQVQLKELLSGKGEVRLMPDGGSGMTNQQSDEIIEAVERTGKKDLYDKFAKEFRETVIIPNLDAQLEYGLIDQEAYDRLVNKYQNYVPLQVVEKAIKKKAGGGGRGKNVSGRDIFKAKGSTFYNYTERYNPLLSSMFAYNNTVVRGEKNRANLALLELAKQDKQQDVFEVIKPKYRAVMDSNGDVKYLVDDTSSFTKENSVELKENGKPIYVQIKDPALLDAMKENGVTRGIRGLYLINSWIRMTATLMNPEFLFTNFARDYETALANIQSDRKEQAVKGVTRFIANPKNIARAGKAIVDDYKGRHNSEWAKAAKEYRENGGQVSWFQRETIDEFVKDTQKKIKAIEKGGRYDQKIFGLVAETMFMAQSTVEQSVRLATYKAFREQGVSPEQSASIAKNITVNFEAKGTWSGFVDSLYVFANAAFQGGFRYGLSIAKSKRARYMAASLVAIGFLESWINDIIGGEDDDDEQINKSIRERNLILLDPSKDSELYFKFPLGYGLNIFKMFGNVAYDVSNGRQEPLDGAKDMLMSIYNQLSPFQGATISQALSPTAFDPIVQAEENTNFFGSLIKPEQPKYGEKKKESDLYFSSARPASKEIAKWVNENTGGSEFKSGEADISPEIIDHYFDAVAGGAGRFIANIGTTGQSLFGEEEKTSVKNVPFLRSFVGEFNKKRNLDYVYDIYKNSSKKKYSKEQLEKFENDLNVAVREESIDTERRDEMIESVANSQIKLDREKEITTLRDEYAKRLKLDTSEEGKDDLLKFTKLMTDYVVFRTKADNGFYSKNKKKESDLRSSLKRRFNDFELNLMSEVTTSYRRKGY